MKREEITELMADFERDHPVEEWKLFDWHVWPLVRNRIAFSLYDKPSSGQHGSKNVDFSNLIKKVISKLPGGRFLRDIGSRMKLAGEQVMARGLDPQLLPPGYPADVIIMTPASRRIMLDGVYYDPYGDPVASVVEELGLTALTWEKGTPQRPRARRASPLTYFQRPHRPYKIPPPADWFVEVKGFFQKQSHAEITWDAIYRRCYHTDRLSRKYEQWLRRSGAKYFILHCWYGSGGQAATLAADRAHVKSVDLQHGLHDKSHFGYGGWVKAPNNGYELVPDAFWCWGTGVAQETHRANPCFQKQSEVMVGGNLWLNKHLQDNQTPGGDNVPDDCKTLVDRAKRTVLVTLQHPGAFDEKLASSIRMQPEQWLWLIRCHPKYNLGDYDAVQRIMSLGSRWIDTRWANNLRLYKLFPLVDLHVTGWSTCAQEALAFGVPTVLLHESGCEAYRSEVENSVMSYVDKPENSLEVFQKALDIRQDDICEAAGRYLCPPDKSLENISRFFEFSDGK